MKAIIWDFDGTLAYHHLGFFPETMMKVLDDVLVGHHIKLEDIKKQIKGRLPWHNPHVEHHNLTLDNNWWDYIEDIFIKVFMVFNIGEHQATYLAKLTHDYYIDHNNFKLYEDTKRTLQFFFDRDWKNIILSNNIPELVDIVEKLELKSLVYRCITSAAIGYEKPHFKAFHIALEPLDSWTKVWVVGDSITCDIMAADKIGFNSILVRNEQGKEKAKYFTSTLFDVSKIIED